MSLENKQGYTCFHNGDQVGFVGSWPHFNPKVGNHSTIEWFPRTEELVQQWKDSRLPLADLFSKIIQRHRSGPFAYLWEGKP